MGAVANVQNNYKVKASTSMFHYPERIANKLEISIERVIAVQKTFASELQAISENINGELDITHDAHNKLKDLKPYLISFTEHVKRIIKNMDNVSRVIESSREGFNISIVNTRGAMTAIHECSERMKNVYEITESITKRISVIAEFAVENKLIAINASVTASKAGEKVRGFKVIASEVSNLSASMAEKVTAVIEDAQRIRNYTNDMLGELQENITMAQRTLDDVDKAFNTLDEIKAVIHKRVREIAGMIQDKIKLEETLNIFTEVLGELDDHITKLSNKAHICNTANEKQNYSISNMLQVLPGLKKLANELALEYKSVDTKSKILHMYELPILETDPALAQLVREFHYAHFTCIRLVRYSTDKKIVPYLAESWNLNADGRTWHFSIKTDARFSDGSPITTDDIQFSFERLINPELKSPYANILNMVVGFEEYQAGNDEHLKGLRIIDDYSFEFVLKRPCNFFLSLLTNGFCSILKRNNVYFNKKFPRESIVSSGSFYWVKGDTDTVDILLANKYFINGQALLDEIHIHRKSENIIDELITGSLDFAYGLPSMYEEELRDKGFRGEIRHYVSRYCYGIVVNYQHENAVTKFPEVRRALVQILDREKIVGDIFGHDVVPAITPLSEAILKLKNNPLPYNPETAQKVLQEKVNDGLFNEVLTLAYIESSIYYGAEQLLDEIRSIFAGIGVKLELVKLASDQAHPDVYRNYDLVFLRFMPEIDFYAALEPFINPHGGDNYFNYDNKDLYQKLQDSIGIKDEDKRRLYFEELLEKFTYDVFMIPLFFRRVLAVIPNYLNEIYLTPEETFVTDAAYINEFIKDKTIMLKQKVLIDDLISKIEESVTINDKIKQGGENLRNIANDILKNISHQKKITSKAEFTLMSYIDNVEKLKKTNNITIDTIHTMIESTQEISYNAQFIQKSLESFLQELSKMIQRVQSIKKDIRDVFNIVKLIEEANATIKSVAVNALIIANKSDDSSEDLKKVSHDIAELVETNSAEISSIIKELQGLDESMKAELAELFTAKDEIDAVIHDIKEHTLQLQGLKPVLDSVHIYTANLERINSELFSRADLVNTAVNAINKSAEIVQNSAESLYFGLALETSVIEIIDDIVLILTNVGALYKTTASCG